MHSLCIIIVSLWSKASNAKCLSKKAKKDAPILPSIKRFFNNENEKKDKKLIDSLFSSASDSNGSSMSDTNMVNRIQETSMPESMPAFVSAMRVEIIKSICAESNQYWIKVMSQN